MIVEKIKIRLSQTIKALLVATIITSCMHLGVSNASDIQKDRELMSAQKVLIDLFNYLSAKQYDMAAPLLVPSELCRKYKYGATFDWKFMAGFSPREERNDKAKVLKNYCNNVGTCLKTSVLHYDEIGIGKYVFEVRFYNSDGTVFALGACCGEVSDGPPATEFNFCVEKINGEFKVRSAPVYVP